MRTFFLDAEKDGLGPSWKKFEQTDGDHGGIEVRTTWACSKLDWFQDHQAWSGLRSLVVQRNQRDTGKKTSTELHLYITTLPAEQVELLALAARTHWAVENELHWVLDMAFDEDQCRVRKDNAPLNLAALRRLALGLLKKETSRKVGAATKRRRAGWDKGYLIKALVGG